MAVASFLLFLLATAWWLAIQTCSVGLPDSTANLSTVWNTSPGHILLRSVPGNNRLAFGAGFYCSYGYDCDTLVFGVCILSKANYTYDRYDPYYPYDPTQVVWSANRDHLVAGNATLNFTADGDLLMQDINGSLVWSTNTSGQSVAGMKITNTGNLVLFNHNTTFVWQSFDHPTDCLLPSQRLVEGMRLTPNSSATNWTTSNRFYLTVLADGLYAFADSSPPQLYYDYPIYIGNSTQQVRPYASLINGSLATFVSPLSTEPDGNIVLPPALSLQYLRFESDGHLRLYEWKEDQKEWSLREDAFKLHDCDYPYVCGEYGICSSGQCSCPTSDMSRAYFTQLDSQIPDLGCIPVIPISCQSLQQHQLIGIPNVSYFNYIYPNESIQIDEEGCKLACLRNCSCRAALFHYFDGYYSSCSLLTHVLSLEGMGHHPEQSFRSTAFLKVQVAHSLPSSNHRVLLVSMVAGVICLLILIILASLIALRRHHKKDDEDEFVDLPGMPTRFTFEVLKVATRDFSDKLGQGGFGSVFKGQLDDERVAVKHLDRAGQGKKEFLAEVQTIGSLHHINLVRLSGFCAEKSHRLLVYEYMPRGSLDKWIYYRDNFVPLDWHTRCKIITDIARGLSYLHEECRQIIAHLDIKPQNILLDDNFNAKVSDFGLSKLIDRDESRVVTRMRGTPGYLAPEWLTSQITEKVDVYSFGVVVMEIISGRKNIDYSQPENSIQLITLLQEKAKNNLLEDMIDRNSDDMLLHKEEVIETMKLATWCLQSDTNKRPSMSVVVKVMERERDVEPNLEYNFFHPSTVISVEVGQPDFSSPPAVSVLSAPR